jgi:hypothetical protein
MNEIPPITDPLGKYWDQPARSEILVDEKHAVMTEETFRLLHEYSATNPTGVYPGKMWRRHDGLFDQRCKPGERRWLLCWYAECEDPKMCATHWREILIA